MNKAKLMDVIQTAGFEPVTYSGRGMHGQTCIGFTCINPMHAILDVVQSCDDVYLDALCDVLRTAKTDQMGCVYVVYFEGFLVNDGEV